MKKISILAVAALAMFSCSKNVNVNPNPVDDQISFKPAISGLQKGSYTAMNNDDNTVVAIDGDHFGVYMMDDGGNVIANNIDFEYSGGIFINGYTTAPQLSWADLIAGTASYNSLSFHSYYPHLSTGATDPANITVTVPTTQTMGKQDTDGNYTTQRTITANDFIYSKNIADAGADKTIEFGTSDVPADRTVRFTYAHALSILEFNILNSSAITDNSWFQKLTLEGNEVYTTGTIDITDANPAVSATTTGSLSIAPATLGSAADKLVSETQKDKSTVIYQMLVIPMSASTTEDAVLTLDARRGSNNTYSSSLNGDKHYTNAFPATTKWEAGKRYKYNIVVSENTIRIDLVKIEDWVEEDGGTLPVAPVINKD